MPPKRIADSTIFENTDDSRILCRDTNIVRLMLRSWNEVTDTPGLTSSQVAGSVTPPGGLLILFRPLIALGFVFILVGISALPAAHAEPIPAQCPTYGKEFAPGGGGEAEWEKCVKEGTINILVTVTDTVIDGKCAEAVIDFRNGTPLQSHLVCDRQTPHSRNFSERADDAKVWVQLKAR